MRWLAISGSIFAFAGPVCAEAPLDLSRLSLEDLSNIEITSVSKRPERLADAAASVYVISNDDVRRSGVQSLPEALRLAPNLNVQRVDALDYGISARGLNGFESANKLLVMIDGRSVYSPFFAGVEWSQLHPDLTDLDRIEVISGPGGALWGSNAVNGVVNVVSRPADLTQGVAVTLSSSNTSQFATGRYGARLGDLGAYRVYLRGYERGGSRRAGGGDAGDDWGGGQVGFRADLGAGQDRVTLQGDVFHDDVESMAPARPDGKLEGGNVLARWTRSAGEAAEFEVQAYYDRYERRARGILDGVITYDVQAQQRLVLGRHKLVLGVGYRRWSDKFDNYVNGFVLDPPRDRNDLANAFAQDQISLGDVTVTLGVKAEHSSFSGTEWLPSARLAWRAADHTLLWGAVSRAVRNPSRLDRDLVFRPFLERSAFEPEELVAYELGYRGRPVPHFSLAATVFYHEYAKLRSSESTPGTGLPIRIGNGLEGETWGLEAWGEYELGEHWRLSGGGSTLGKDFRASTGSTDRSNLAATGHDPALQLFLRSQARLSDQMDLDLRLRHVARVPAERTPGSLRAPAYTELDARVSWRLSEQIEVSLAGFNLLDASHPEATEPRRTEMRRSVQVALRYGW